MGLIVRLSDHPRKWLEGLGGELNLWKRLRLLIFGSLDEVVNGAWFEMVFVPPDHRLNKIEARSIIGVFGSLLS